jgi:hypothetical protein
MARLKEKTIQVLQNKPIYTNDFNKIRKYQDSLDAYNSAIDMENALIEWNKNKTTLNKNKYLKAKDNNYNHFLSEYDSKFYDELKKRGYNYINSPSSLQTSYFYPDLETPYDSRKGKGIGDNSTASYILAASGSNAGDALFPFQKPVQPYIRTKEEINPISPIAKKEIDIEEEGIKPVELKNKKVSVEEPEHWLDITEPNGKESKRMYFESKEEKESFLKDNPMLRIGQNTVAKIKTETLEYLKKKK